MTLKTKDRVIVRRCKSQKYGTITGETKDGLSWIVLIDGNRGTTVVGKDKVERLKPEQLAFYWGKST